MRAAHHFKFPVAAVCDRRIQELPAVIDRRYMQMEGKRGRRNHFTTRVQVWLWASDCQQVRM
jgi:hypothetical protein